MSEKQAPARRYSPGIGEAVANRTINRKIYRPYKYKKGVTVCLERSDDQSLDDKVKQFAEEKGYEYEDYKVTGENEDGHPLCTMHVTGRYAKENWADVADRVALGNASLHL